MDRDIETRRAGRRDRPAGSAIAGTVDEHDDLMPQGYPSRGHGEGQRAVAGQEAEIGTPPGPMLQKVVSK
jgi:hypothetical protein